MSTSTVAFAFFTLPGCAPPFLADELDDSPETAPRLPSPVTELRPCAGGSSCCGAVAAAGALAAAAVTGLALGLAASASPWEKRTATTVMSSTYLSSSSHNARAWSLHPSGGLRLGSQGKGRCHEAETAGLWVA